jgi:hypothetical protein
VESGDLETVDGGEVGVSAAGMVETDKPSGGGDGATPTATATQPGGWGGGAPAVTTPAMDFDGMSHFSG